MLRALILSIASLGLAPILATAQVVDRDHQALPPDFEGKVAYFGNYTGTSSVLAEQPRGARDVPCPFRDSRCRKATVGGGVKVVLEFKAQRMIGFFYAVDGFRGPEGLKIGSLTGRRTADGTCELFQADGSRWTGGCGRSEFTGAITTADGIPNAFDIRFQTVAMHMRDERTVRERSWEASRRERRIALLHSQLGGAPREAFYAAAQLESYSWLPAGINAERIAAPNFPKKFKRSRVYDLRSEFVAPDGAPGGWLMVRFEGEHFKCIASARRPNCSEIAAPLPLMPDNMDDDPDGWFTADGRVITELRAAEPGR